jgi:hypothetical protein
MTAVKSGVTPCVRISKLDTAMPLFMVMLCIRIPTTQVHEDCSNRDIGYPCYMLLLGVSVLLQSSFTHYEWTDGDVGVASYCKSKFPRSILQVLSNVPRPIAGSDDLCGLISWFFSLGYFAESHSISWRSQFGCCAESYTLQ